MNMTPAALLRPLWMCESTVGHFAWPTFGRAAFWLIRQRREFSYIWGLLRGYTTQQPPNITSFPTKPAEDTEKGAGRVGNTPGLSKEGHRRHNMGGHAAQFGDATPDC